MKVVIDQDLLVASTAAIQRDSGGIPEYGTVVELTADAEEAIAHGDTMWVAVADSSDADAWMFVLDGSREAMTMQTMCLGIEME